MLMSTIAFRQAHELDCYDALLINHRYEITEGTRTNIFFLPSEEGLDASEVFPQVDRVFTPPVKDVLDGITRKTIVLALEARGIVCVEKPLPLDMLFSGGVSVWLSSTSTKIMPIREVENPIAAQNYSGPNHALNPEVLRNYPESLSLPVHPSIRVYQKIYDEYLKDYSESITHGSGSG
jgi:branched-subunit amino acid aminotransferase/4-amino-4-deoxychorismate lyase